MNYLGDFINGKFIPVQKPDGSIKDVSPGDLNDTIMVASFSHSHVYMAV